MDVENEAQGSSMLYVSATIGALALHNRIRQLEEVTKLKHGGRIASFPTRI